MKNVVPAAFAVVSVAAALIAGAGYGTASASGRASIKGEDVKTAIATSNFAARNTGDSDDDVMGDFRGEAAAPLGGFVALAGPITCLHVDGNRAGFLYPVEDDSKPTLLKGQFVLITVEDGGPGASDHMGFTGPGPKSLFPNCDPQVAPLEVTGGDIEVNDGD